MSALPKLSDPLSPIEPIPLPEIRFSMWLGVLRLIGFTLAALLMWGGLLGIVVSHSYISSITIIIGGLLVMGMALIGIGGKRV